MDETTSVQYAGWQDYEDQCFTISHNVKGVYVSRLALNNYMLSRVSYCHN